MATSNSAAWIRAGFIGLVLYGVLTLWASTDPQPNPAEEYDAWARFVTADRYALTHVFGTGLGVMAAILGTFGLGAHLAGSRAPRLGLWGMVVAVLGQCMFLFFAGVSAFGSPMEGQAYLAGMNLDGLPESTASVLQVFVMLAAILLSLVGNVLLGTAIWRSGTLPRWAGALWAFAAVLMYPLGIVLGALTTGATPLTVPVGAALVAAGGAWMFWHTLRRPGGFPVQEALPVDSRRAW